jgi:hypothetical protein
MAFHNPRSLSERVMQVACSLASKGSSGTATTSLSMSPPRLDMLIEGGGDVVGLTTLVVREGGGGGPPLVGDPLTEEKLEKLKER